MRKKMIVVALCISALVGVVYLIGLSLPKQQTFVKTRTLSASPEKVFEVVTDVKSQPAWRTDIRTIQLIDDSTWTEFPKQGTPITFKAKRKIPHQLFEIEIIAPKTLKGYWVGTFEQVSSGTKIVFQEVIIIDNPLLRVMSSLFFDMDKTMELYLTQLENKLAQ